MMKRNIIFAGLLSAGILLSAPVAMAATPLSVSVNESRYVQEAGLSRVAVGNPEIADVQLLSAREFLLVGKKLVLQLYWCGGQMDGRNIW